RVPCRRLLRRLVTRPGWISMLSIARGVTIHEGCAATRLSQSRFCSPAARSIFGRSRLRDAVYQIEHQITAMPPIIRGKTVSKIPHFLVHSPKDNVGVVVVEGLKAGTNMLGV